MLEDSKAFVDWRLETHEAKGLAIIQKENWVFFLTSRAIVVFQDNVDQGQFSLSDQKDKCQEYKSKNGLDVLARLRNRIKNFENFVT